MMKMDFRHMKEQIKAGDAAVSAVMTRLDALPAPTPVPSYRRVAVMAASLSLVALAVIAAVGIGSAFLQNSQPTPPVPPLIGTEGDMQTNATDTQAPQGETAPLPETEDAATTGTVETTPVPVETEPAIGSGDIMGQWATRGLDFSKKAQAKLDAAAPDELISVVMFGVMNTSLYDSSQMCDGKTLQEWYDEREQLWKRMFFLQGQLKYNPSLRTPELEQEHAECQAEIERLTEIIEKEKERQKATFFVGELAWLKTLGIEAEYKEVLGPSGYFYFSATADVIRNISGGRCYSYYVSLLGEENEKEEEKEKDESLGGILVAW